MEKRIDYIRRTIDKSDKNWKRISFNDFEIKYSQVFYERMKDAKPVRLKETPHTLVFRKN